MRFLPSVPDAALLFSLLALPACTVEVEQGEGGGGGDASQPAEEGDPGLFACSFQQACPAVSSHIGPEPADAVACQNTFIAAGDAGVLLYRSTPGPYLNVTETLSVFFGDGTVLRQSRHKECQNPCYVQPPWEDATAQELCEVVVHGDLAACSPQLYTHCDAYVEYVNCHAVEQMDCAAVLAELPPEG